MEKVVDPFMEYLINETEISKKKKILTAAFISIKFNVNESLESLKSSMYVWIRNMKSNSAKI